MHFLLKKNEHAKEKSETPNSINYRKKKKKPLNAMHLPNSTYKLVPLGQHWEDSRVE